MFYFDLRVAVTKQPTPGGGDLTTTLSPMTEAVKSSFGVYLSMVTI